jgi:hypothetical protein
MIGYQAVGHPFVDEGFQLCGIVWTLDWSCKSGLSPREGEDQDEHERQRNGEKTAIHGMSLSCVGFLLFLRISASMVACEVFQICLPIPVSIG